MARGIVTVRREGATIMYALADPMLAELLLVAKKILNRRLVGVQSLLQELDVEPRPARRGARHTRRTEA